jgi:hypothetical protein
MSLLLEKSDKEILEMHEDHLEELKQQKPYEKTLEEDEDEEESDQQDQLEKSAECAEPEIIEEGGCYTEFYKFIKPYKSDKESSRVIYGGRIWRSERSHDIIYLYDYFETYQQHRYNGRIDYTKKEITFKDEYGCSTTFKNNKFKDFTKKAIWLRKDLEAEIIQKIHIELLKSHVQKYHSIKYSKADILRLEEFYRSNLEKSIEDGINSISGFIYTAAIKGSCFLTASFDISNYTVTGSHLKKINFTIPNSDDVTRRSLHTYVPFIMKDLIDKWSGHPFDETVGKELFAKAIENMLIARYPHMKISVLSSGEILPTFEIRFIDSVESCLA